jgi:hypothetical protein
MYLILQTALDPGVYSVSNINQYKKKMGMFLGSRDQPALKADNLTAICERTV